MISLHGGGGTGAGQEALTDFDAVADAADLLVVYPDGYDKSWADGRGRRRRIAVISTTLGSWSRWPQSWCTTSTSLRHVFATGMSNGGFMSNRLACDRADIFAAVAPVAGTLGVGVTCNPSRPVSVLEAHGTADPLVPFNGGAVRGRGGLSHSISVASLVDRWRAVDGCQGDPSAAELPDVGDGTMVHLFDSSSCAAGTEVISYQIDNGGHTWPGGRQYLPKAVIGATTRAFDGSQVIAQFFATHGRD